jgi:hypothetical protein
LFVSLALAFIQLLLLLVNILEPVGQLLIQSLGSAQHLLLIERFQLGFQIFCAASPMIGVARRQAFHHHLRLANFGRQDFQLNGPKRQAIARA